MILSNFSFCQSITSIVYSTLKHQLIVMLVILPVFRILLASPTAELEPITEFHHQIDEVIYFS